MSKSQIFLLFRAFVRKANKLIGWIWKSIWDNYLPGLRVISLIIVTWLLILWWPSFQSFQISQVKHCSEKDFELFLHYSDKSAPGETKKIDITVRNISDKTNTLRIILLPSSEEFIFPNGSMLLFNSVKPYESISQNIEFKLVESPFDELSLELAYTRDNESQLFNMPNCRSVFYYSHLQNLWNIFTKLPPFVSNLSTFFGFISSLFVTFSVITGKSADLFRAIIKVLGYKND